MITVLLQCILLGAFLTGCSSYEKYEERDGKMYFKYKLGISSKINEREIVGADIATFKVLERSDFSVDKNNVYHDGVAIKNTAPKTFTFLDKHYAKDENNVFYNKVRPIENADPNTFEILKGNFAKDKNEVYYAGYPLGVCDVSKFKILDINEFELNTWSTDGCYYYSGSFKIPSDDYKNTIYYKDSGMAKDLNFVYWGKFKIAWIDAKSFEIVDARKHIYKDKDGTFKISGMKRLALKFTEN